MSSPAKFLFDTDFGTTDRNKAAMVPLAEHTARVAEADVLGFRKGHAAAKAEAEQRTAAALERIAAALAELNRGLSAVETRLENEAVEVAVAVARQLAPELIAREPFGRARGARRRLLPSSGGGTACGGARQRGAAWRGAREARGNQPRRRLRRPPGRAGRARHRAWRL